MKKVAFSLLFLFSTTFSLASCGGKKSYTVTWKNYDGAILEIDENVAQGSVPKYDGATPSRPADTQYTYTFSGWDKDISKGIEDNTTFTAQYVSVKNDYTVTFDGKGGTLVSGTEVQKVKSPSEIVPPVYEREDYVFTGWDKDLSTITTSTTVYAQWEYSPSDDTSLEIDGFTKKDNKLSNKTNNDITTFSFTSNVHVGKGATWKLYSDIEGRVEIITKTISLNIGDNTVYINVTAKSGRNELYTIVVRRLNMFTISWVDEDGTTPLSTTYVQEDDTPEYDKETPTKEPTAQYTYTFAGWDPVPYPSNKNETYKATYSHTTNKYTIYWYNDVEETNLLHYEELEYGKMPEYHWTDVLPSKAETDRIRYDWNGDWEETVTTVTGEAHYHAKFDEVNKYLVTFMDEDRSTVLQEGYFVAEDEMPEYKGETPTKESSAQYTYKFDDWNPKITKPTEDTIYYATYTPTLKKYTISWYNDKEETKLLHSEELEYGDTPSYHWTDVLPTKPATDRIRYDWNGKWEETIVSVTGEAHYHAKFDEVNKYLVTFKNYDGEVLQESYVASDNMPIYKGKNPTRPADAQYTYEPLGWDKDIVMPKNDTVYIYTYEPHINKYKITWKGGINGDKVLDEEMVDYGSMPTAPANVPDITEGIYVYTFYSWSPIVTKVTGEATYVAQYKQELIKFDITWKTYDDEVKVSVPYGTIPSYSGTPTKVINNHSFEWLGWDKEVLPATHDETYIAVFNNDITFDFEGICCTINGKTEFTDVYTFDESEEPALINYVIKPIGSYTLPDTISVYVDNNLVTSGYTYDKSTGAFSIASNLGNIRLEVTGV